jgi:hypothetical protein
MASWAETAEGGINLDGIQVDQSVFLPYPI